MRYRHNFRTIFVLSAFMMSALMGCLPDELPVDLEQAESKLVVSSQVIPDELMVISVSRSFSALNGANDVGLTEDELQEFLVDNALVTITYNGQTDTLPTSEFTPGFYLSLFELEEENQQFDLYIYDSTSGDEVRATSFMLPQVALDTARAYAEINEDGDTSIYIHYGFTDPSEENWYVFDAFKLSGDANFPNIDIGLSTESSNELWSELHSDLTFADSTFERTIELFEGSIGDTVGVMLSNISEDYYRFVDARQRTGGIIASITSEPINHPTNVDNGYGFFNTHNPSVQVLIIEGP